MARIGEKRVSKFVDYERDIKGKRLIRLSAGVGSGKNYFIAQISEKYPDLRILLITSRINIVNAQAKKLKAQTFIDIDKLMSYDEDWGWMGNEKYKRIACTNARIEKFVKNKYNAEDSVTHIWNNFDLIVVDEVHSLTMDATFSDSPFYVEKFIKQAYRENHNCDILLMSGTQEPVDWLFDGIISNKVTNIDLFDDCIHLEPDKIILFSKTRVLPKLKEFLDKGERIIYFANYIGNISSIVNKLVTIGVDPEIFGFSFNCGNNDVKKFPKQVQKNLRKNIKLTNDSITQYEKLPENVRILFTTSKNKEGITIGDDDVKIMFVESSNKNDIKQMAGRVRGNSKTGKGIHDLAIIYDAHQHRTKISEYEIDLQHNCILTANSTLQEHHQNCLEADIFFNLNNAISTTEDTFKYIRYDYFRKKFTKYVGRIHGDIQNYNYYADLCNIVTFYDSEFFSDNRTGKEFLEQEWFPFSKVALFMEVSTSDKAKQLLDKYLINHQLLNIVFDRKKHDALHEHIAKLTHLYSCKDIGIKNPYTGNFQLKPALEKFGYELVYRQHGKTYSIKPIGEEDDDI